MEGVGANANQRMEKLKVPHRAKTFLGHSQRKTKT